MIKEETCHIRRKSLKSAMNFIKATLVKLVRIYQLAISPLLGPRCRFTPTCSHYTIEALRKLPLHIALYKSVLRVLSCHPFNKGGYDPVIECEQDPHQPCKKH
jgi:putative membrane protein insertion efficiency factor